MYSPPTDETKTINVWYGSGQNANLSNLAYRPFVARGPDDKDGNQTEVSYQSVEHAYQTWKGGSFNRAVYSDRRWKGGGTKIRSQVAPQTQENWNVRMMKGAMLASFRANPKPMLELLRTGDATITHTQDKGVWGEVFPQLLMEVRDEIARDIMETEEGITEEVAEHQARRQEAGQDMPLPTEPLLQSITMSAANDPDRRKGGFHFLHLDVPDAIPEQWSIVARMANQHGGALSEPSSADALGGRRVTFDSSEGRRAFIANIRAISGRVATDDSPAFVGPGVNLSMISMTRMGPGIVDAFLSRKQSPARPLSLDESIWDTIEAIYDKNEAIAQQAIQTLTEWLPDGSIPTDGELAMLYDFAIWRSTWQDQIRRNIELPGLYTKRDGNGAIVRDGEGKPVLDTKTINDKRSFVFRRLSQAFNPTLGGALSDNLITAIAASAWLYMVERGGKTSNTDEEVNSILQRNVDTFVTSEESELFRHVGMSRNLAVNILGKQVTDFIGWRQDNRAAGVPRSFLHQLRLDLGHQALYLLTQRIEIGSIKEGIWNSPMITVMLPFQGGEGRFIKANSWKQIDRRENPQMTGNPHIDSAKAAHREGGDFLRTLLLPPSEQRPAASPEPVEIFPQDKRRRSWDRVGKTQAAAINRLNQMEWQVDTRKLGAFLKLPGEAQNIILGIQDLKTASLGVIDSVTGKNLTLNNALLDLRADPWNSGTTFYIPNYPWKQSRVGQDSTDINPQRSKIHRAFVFQPAWKATIEPSESSRLLYLSAVAQRLGFDPGKLDSSKIIEAIDNVFEDDTTKGAIAAIEALLKDGAMPSEKNIVDLVVAINKFGEGALSFQALADWTMNRQAFMERKPFVTNLSLEVDGTNNGIALSAMHLGDPVLLYNFAENFGYSTSGATVPEWRSGVSGGSPNPDIAEQFAIDVERTIRESMSNRDGPMLNGLTVLLGSLSKPIKNEDGQVIGDTATSDGRSLMKTPLLALTFGGGLRNIMNQVRDKTAKAFLARLNEATTLDQALVAIRAMNAILSPHGVSFKEPASIEKAKTIVMDWSALNALGKSVSRIYRKPLEKVVNKKMGVMQERAKIVNNALNTMARRWEAVRGYAIAKETGRMIEAKELAATKGRAYFNLPESTIARIEKELGDALPRVHTWLSMQDGDLRSGYQPASLSGTFPHESDTDNLALNQEGQSQGKMLIVGPDGKPLREEYTVTSRAQRESPGRPGNAGWIGLLHAFDSAVNARVYAKFDVLNLHDAAQGNVAAGADMAVAMNKALWDGLSEYSIMHEVHEAMVRQDRALEALIDADPKIGQVLELMEAEWLHEIKAEQTLEQPITTDSFREVALGAEIIRAEMIATAKAISQYSMGSMAFRPTEGEREAAMEAHKKRISNLGGNIDLLLQEEERPTRSATSRSGLDSPMGELALREEKGPLAQELVKAASGRKPLSMQSTVDRAIRSGAYPREAEQVLKQSTRLLKGAQIKLIEPDTDVSQSARLEAAYDSGRLRNARGLYDQENNIIWLKSGAFRLDGLNPTTFLHEVLHGALNRAITEAEGMDTSKVRPGTDEARLVEAHRALQGLLDEATPHLEKAGYTSATANVHEFISHAMTDKSIQGILGNVKRTDGRTLWKRLIDWMRSVLNLPRRDAVAQGTILASLLNEVSNLSAAADSLGIGGHSRAGANPDALFFAENDDARAWTPLQVFDALESDVDGRLGTTRYAREYLELITGRLTNGEMDTGKLSFTVEGDADSVWLNATTTGKSVWSSEMATLLPINRQLAFAMEAIQIAVDASLKADLSISNTIRSLYERARKEVKGENLHHDPETGRRAKDLIFRTEKEKGKRSSHLARFVAAALVYPELGNELRKIDARSRTEAEGTLKAALEWVDAVVTKSVGAARSKNAEAALREATEKLAHTYAKKRLWLEKKQMQPGTSVASRQIMEMIDSAWEGEDGLGARMSAPRQSLPEVVEQYLNRGREGLSDQQEKLLASIWRDLRGETEANSRAVQLLAYAGLHAQTRRKLLVEVAAQVRDSFDRTLTGEEEKALYWSLLRADMQSLHGREGIEWIRSTISSRESLMERKAEVEAELFDLATTRGRKTRRRRRENGGTETVPAILDNAQALGRFMVTGKVTASNLRLSAASQVAMMVEEKMIDGTNHARAMDLVDRLATLHALSELPETVMETTRRIIAEQPRGVETTLAFHELIERRAREQAFGGNPMLMVKGHVRDIMDPTMTMVAAERGITGTNQLEKAGYHKVQSLGEDHTGRQMELWAIRDGGMTKFTTGAISLTGRGVKGMKAILENHEEGRGITGLVPIVDGNGQIAGHRWIMNESIKSQVLDPDRRLPEVMGSTWARTWDKIESVKMNAKVVDYIEALHKQEFPGLMEWNRMHPNQQQDAPADMRQRMDAMNEQFKSEWLPIRDGELIGLVPAEVRMGIAGITGDLREMRMRPDLFRILFGYRRPSIRNLTHTNPENLSGITRILADYIGTLEAKIPEGDKEVDGGSVEFVGSKLGNNLSTLESTWQEIVRKIKDVWVIRSGSTLIGNELSNITLLLAQGIPMKEIVEGKATATAAAIQFRRDERERDSLDRLLQSGMVPEADRYDTTQRIGELEDALARNPVRNLVNSGMYQLLAEEVGPEPAGDKHSWTGRLENFVNRKTGNMPGKDFIKRVGSIAMISPGTNIYDFMSRATILSDFTSRFILERHLKAQGNLSNREILKRVRETFVNYDLPINRKMQYVSEMMVIPFVKYYIGMQKILMRTLAEQPERTLLLGVLQAQMEDMQTVMQAGFWDSPLNITSGPLEIPGAIEDLATVAGLDAIIEEAKKLDE